MNNILFYDIQLYLDKLNKIYKFEDEYLLQEMENLANKLNFPIVNRSVGRLLYIITKLKKPKLVVEIGSGYGYSAYWFAKAIDNGKVVLTDYKKENIEIAKNFLKNVNPSVKFEFRIGNGIEIAKEYKDVDIFFFDHEKSRYMDTVLQIKDNIKPGGLLIADNTLWHGKVLEEDSDNQTKKIKEFNEYMFSNEEFFCSLIPIRDGVLVALKI